MNILITGGAGFIGHNTAIHLKNHGHHPIVYDNLKNSTTKALTQLQKHKIPITKADLLNPKTLKTALSNIDTVIHAAAYISVNESTKKPAKYVRNNVEGTTNIAKTCKDNNIKLIYISTAAVYGEPQTLPLNETHPTNPISPYGITKLQGEQIINYYATQGLKHITLRLFNVYGPGQSNAYAGVITRFMQAASLNKAPIIYGDGQQTRDFIHVEDVAEAIKLAVQSNNTNETFNIASGKPTTINNIATLILQHTNPNLKPKHAKQKPNDIRHSYADITKAQKLLNFKPKITLHEGIKNLITKTSNIPTER
ncbi:MAG: GDP-mannose 4,6-dehydratase [Candidatus Bathyarchaeia archaeon]